jgi:hypothetical protein
MKNDNAKVSTPSEVLAVAAKSDVAPTRISRHNSVEHPQPQKHSYVVDVFTFSCTQFVRLGKLIMRVNQRIGKWVKSRRKSNKRKINNDRHPRINRAHIERR